MKIALYGASGTIGQRILREAVQRGHEVAAISRDPSKIPAGPKTKTAKGDVLDPSSIAEVIKGQDAAINATSPAGGKLETVLDAARALIKGLTAAKVNRLIVVGGAGSLEVAPGVQLINTPEFPGEWKGIAQVHVDALNIYKTEANNLDWTYFSPAALIQPGERTGKFRIGTTKLITDAKGTSQISAEDFAVALLDELENPAHIKQQMTVAY